MSDLGAWLSVNVAHERRLEAAAVGRWAGDDKWWLAREQSLDATIKDNLIDSRGSARAS